MSIYSIKKEDHMRKPTLHFHNMGIWDEDVTNDIGWKLRTLSSIIKELNHEQVGETLLQVLNTCVS